MKTFKQYLDEAKKDLGSAKRFNNWRFPTPEEMRKAATNIKYDVAKQKAKIIDLPAQFYKKDTSRGGLFEPFTRKDIADGDLPENAEKILKGFLQNKPMAMIVMVSRNGKLEIMDGYTRTGVAAPLGIKVKAVVITPSMFDYRLEESTKDHQDYMKSLQLKLSKDELTDDQLKDFARRSNGYASSPNQLSAIADIDAMSPNHLQQIINHKKVHVFMKHRARQRLSGKWK